MTRVKTDDARTAFEALVREKASEAARTNSLISRTEERTLDPFLAKSSQGVREAGGPGTRVNVDALTARAVTDAEQAWNRHNPPGRGQDSTYLSQAEIREITKDDPALGALTKTAYVRVREAAAAPNAATAVVAFFDRFHFAPDEETGVWPLSEPLPGGQMIDARDPAVRAALPAGVQESWNFYHRAEQADWAGVRLQSARIDGHDVFVNFTTTDGDYSYLEVLSKNGNRLVSGRLQGGEFIGWDEVFGRCRFSPSMIALDNPVHEEGLSEAPERAAAGQVPQDFVGDLQLDHGRLTYHPASYRLDTVDVPGLAGHPREELALASLEYLWENSMKFRLVGSQEPFEFGRRADGALYLGEHVRNDGKVYEVASWRDIDDGSFVLYFDRTDNDRLRLATIQFDN